LLQLSINFEALPIKQALSGQAEKKIEVKGGKDLPYLYMLNSYVCQNISERKSANFFNSD